jgi:hypothetical protein
MRVKVNGRSVIIEEVDANDRDDVCILSAIWEDTDEEVDQATYDILHKQVDLDQLWLDQKISEADFMDDYERGI